jgi:hypothetical protein
MKFEEAWELVLEAGLKSTRERRQWCRDQRPATIPSNPELTYAGKVWVSWPHWLGYDKFLPFAEAQALVWEVGVMPKASFTFDALYCHLDTPCC